MFGSIAKSLFGNANDRVIKAMKPLVQAINDREGDFADLDQAAVRAKIDEIRDAIIGGHLIVDAAFGQLPDPDALADALHAQHGRETPSADHAMVFKNFAWYQPDPTYTDARLTDLDRANLEMVNDPPPPVVDEVIDDQPAVTVADVVHAVKLVAAEEDAFVVQLSSVRLHALIKERFKPFKPDPESRSGSPPSKERAFTCLLPR